MMNDQETSSLGQTPPADAGTPAASASLGSTLASARESRGWTIEQVSHYLKLAPRQIEAIEADNLAALPGLAVTRGFIRSYAKLLSVDVSAHMARLGGGAASSDPTAPRQPLATPFKEGRRGAGVRRSAARRPPWVVMSASLLVVGVVAAAAWQFSREHRSAAGASPVSASRPLQNETTDRDGADSGQAMGSAAVQAPLADPAGTVSGPSGAVVAGGESVSNQGASASAQAAAAPAAAAGNILELVMNKDSWLEVRRIDTKQVIASRLVKAGTIETFEIDAPVALKIGNASGVRATFRGEPLDLIASAPNNIARLTLK